MTQQEKIIKIMERDPQRWYIASDFMKQDLGELFVGYEATARLSELANKGLFDTKRVGRFRAVRLKVKEMPMFEGTREQLNNLTIKPEQPKAVSWLND